jgi:hypothetical protein
MDDPPFFFSGDSRAIDSSTHAMHIFSSEVTK